jgi:N-acetylneuraminate synthase
MIDAAADACVNAIKFQTHLASEESTYDDSFRVTFSYADKNRYDYWERIEFTESEWLGLANHARERGLEFISSPFSIAAVNLLERIGVKLWKIGSGELLNTALLECLLHTNKPLIASTGLHSWDEIASFVNTVRLHSCEFALLQCTSSYPTSLDQVGINVLAEITKRYGCLTGLSDHSGMLAPSLFAIANGASILEVHCTYDRRMFGPDSSSSLTFIELDQLARLRDDFYVLQTSIVDKDCSALQRVHTKQLFDRSLSPKIDLRAGHIMRLEDFSFRKPGIGISPADISRYVGKILKNDVSSKRLFKREDFLL